MKPIGVFAFHVFGFLLESLEFVFLFLYFWLQCPVFGYDFFFTPLFEKCAVFYCTFLNKSQIVTTI